MENKKLTDRQKRTIKGEIGEAIIREYFEKKGWVIYFPFTKDRAHYFDMLATKNKKEVIALDVKTKARLNKWPAQGINIRTYNEYIGFTDNINIPFYLIFIDDKNGDVHCADIKTLKNGFNPTPYIIAWYLIDMISLFNIGKEKINELSQYDTRNYDYEPNKTYDWQNRKDL